MRLHWNETKWLPQQPFSQQFSFRRLRSTRQISRQSEKPERSWTRRRKSCRTSWIRPWLISIDSNRKPHHGKILLRVVSQNRFNMSQNSQLQKWIVSYFGHIGVNLAVSFFPPFLSPVFQEIFIISFWVFYSLQCAESESWILITNQTLHQHLDDIRCSPAVSTSQPPPYIWIQSCFLFIHGVFW